VFRKNRDEESETYSTSYIDSDFLDAIQQHNGMAGTAEIAENVDVPGEQHLYDLIHWKVTVR
jgi:hypothetical protein